MKTVLIEKEGYSPFIDFLKGISILCVLWTHVYVAQSQTLFVLWGGMAVPAFLLIQVVHAYRNGLENVHFPKIKKVFSRVLLPALIVWALLFIINLLGGNVRYADQVLTNWGYGPGCYYPWLYIEFAFLLPLVAMVLKRIKRPVFIFLSCLGVSVLLEVFCALVHPAPWLYSKLFFRYFFLIYLGYEWIEKGITLSVKNALLALVSAAFILAFQYYDLNMEPIFYDSAWKVHHWICYFWLIYVLVFLLAQLHQSKWFPCWIRRIIEFFGKASWDIFVCQMFVFALIWSDRLDFVANPILRMLVFVVSTLFLSLVLGCLLYTFRTSLKRKRNDKKANQAISSGSDPAAV